MSPCSPGSGPPLLPQEVDANARLRPPGLERRHLRRSRRAAAVCGHVLEDLRAALREAVDDRPRDAAQVRGPAVNRPPLQPEPLDDLAPQLGLVEEAGGPRVPVEVTGVERGPPAIRSQGQVPGDDVRVQQRIAGARGAVAGRRPRRTLRPAPAPLLRGRAAPGTLPARDSPARRDSRVVGFAELVRHFRVGNAPEDAHRLRRPEGHIEASDGPSAYRLTETATGEHSLEIPGLHLPGEPRGSGGRAQPHPGLLALTE